MGQPKIPNHQMYQHMANTVQATFDQSSTMTSVNDATGPISVNTDFMTDVQQPYSPSDIYSESGILGK